MRSAPVDNVSDQRERTRTRLEYSPENSGLFYLESPCGYQEPVKKSENRASLSSIGLYIACWRKIASISYQDFDIHKDLKR